MSFGRLAGAREMEMVKLDETALLTLLSLGDSGSSDLFNKIFNLFEENSPQLIDTIQTAYASGDTDAVRIAAHSLKSSAAYLGGIDLSDSCKSIERAARSDSLQAQSETIDGLNDCYEATRLSIIEFYNSQKGQQKAA